MNWFSPPRHQGHQARLPAQEKPQITQMNADPTPPPTSQPRRHEDTKKSQSPPTHPALPTDHTDEHRWVHVFWLCAARSRPSDDGREPLGQETAPNSSFRSSFLAQRPALCERRPRRFSFSFNGWDKPTPQHNEKRARQNRRANGTSTGKKTGCDERSHSEQAVFSPVTGDPRSPVVLPPRSVTTFQVQRPPLCVGGWVSGLRVFVPSCLRRGWARLRRRAATPWQAGCSVSSVSLWFFDRRIPRIG